MSIGIEEILRIAELARLDLTAEEVDVLGSQLETIVDYVGRLAEVDTRSVPPLGGSSVEPTPLRPDVVRPGAGSEGALRNAPDAVEGFFRTPWSLSD